ncbi:MAG: GNAT family N-acetyltransferase [Sphingomonadaceae bacterium]
MFVRTERLLLRPGWPEDAAALAGAIAREAIVLNLASAPWPYETNDAEAYLGRARGEGEVDFLIFARTMGAPRLIGGIGLARDGDDLELGYWIVPSHWGLGFATEAGRAVIETARDTLRLERLVAGHFVDNPASGRVLHKLGFAPSGEVYPRVSRARGTSVPCRRFVLNLQALALAA